MPAALFLSALAAVAITIASSWYTIGALRRHARQPARWLVGARRRGAAGPGLGLDRAALVPGLQAVQAGTRRRHAQGYRRGACGPIAGAGTELDRAGLHPQPVHLRAGASIPSGEQPGGGQDLLLRAADRQYLSAGAAGVLDQRKDIHDRRGLRADLGAHRSPGHAGAGRGRQALWVLATGLCRHIPRHAGGAGDLPGRVRPAADRRAHPQGFVADDVCRHCAGP